MIATAIVHDYLTQRGGAERTVLALSRALPEAPIYTSLFDPDATFAEFAGCDVKTSAVNRVGVLRRRHRLALPLLAPAFSAMKVDADVVVCSSSGWAHGVRTNGTKIVYCHAPARWLYQSDAYTAESSTPVKMALGAMRRPLLQWDRRAANTADIYIVNSTRTRDLVRTVYGFDPEVIHPPHGVSAGEIDPVQGLDPGFFLCVSRLLPYKNVDAILAAFDEMPAERVVIVGSGPDADRLRTLAPANVSFLQDVPDGQLRWLYSNAQALLAVGLEDFGLTPVEAANFGTPTIARAFGGYLDTVTGGTNGLFLEGLDPADFRRAFELLRAEPLSPDVVSASAERFSENEFARRINGVVDRAREGSSVRP